MEPAPPRVLGLIRFPRTKRLYQTALYVIRVSAQCSYQFCAAPFVGNQNGGGVHAMCRLRQSTP